MRRWSGCGKNFYIVLSTGRDMDNYYSKQYGDLVRPDAVIHLNGTKITVGDQLIYEHRMDQGLLERVLDYADKSGYAIGVTIGMRIIICTRRRWRRWICTGGDRARGALRIRGGTAGSGSEDPGLHRI